MVGRLPRGVLSFEASLAFLVGVLMDSLFREERRGRRAGGMLFTPALKHPSSRGGEKVKGFKYRVVS